MTTFFKTAELEHHLADIADALLAGDRVCFVANGGRIMDFDLVSEPVRKLVAEAAFSERFPGRAVTVEFAYLRGGSGGSAGACRRPWPPMTRNRGSGDG